MPSIFVSIMVSCVLALTALQVRAQSDAKLTEIQRATTTEVKALDDATADTSSTGLTSKIVIEGSEDKAVATLRVGNYFGSSPANVFNWSLTASAPFSGEKEKERQIGDLSGLTAGSTATLNLGWVGIDSIDKRAKRSELNVAQVTNKRMDEACEPYTKEIFGGPLKDVKDIAKLPRDINCTESLFDESLFDKSPIVLQLREQSRLDPAARAQLEKLIAARKQYQDRYWRILGRPGPIWTAGVRLQAGKTSFKYRLDTDLSTEIEDSKTSGSVGVYLNRIYHRQLIGLAYNRVTNYEAGRATQICTPIGTTGALECNNRILGAPTRTAPDIISAEWRYLSSFRTIAISPIVEYDLDTHDWAARFPIYGAINQQGDLVGGLRIDWDSKEDDVGAVVFFGKKFSFFD